MALVGNKIKIIKWTRKGVKEINTQLVPGFAPCKLSITLLMLNERLEETRPGSKYRFPCLLRFHLRISSPRITYPGVGFAGNGFY